MPSARGVATNACHGSPCARPPSATGPLANRPSGPCPG